MIFDHWIERAIYDSVCNSVYRCVRNNVYANVCDGTDNFSIVATTDGVDATVCDSIEYCIHCKLKDYKL
jgi:hypothetical protein